MTDCLLVFCTCPDQATAGVIATALLEERLAACVNRLPGIRSLYRWEGHIEKDDEVLLLLKTPAARFAAIEAEIGRLHPYDVPEIVAVPIAAGSSAYLDWIGNSTA